MNFIRHWLFTSIFSAVVLITLSSCGNGPQEERVTAEKLPSVKGILNGNHVGLEEAATFGAVLGLQMDENGLCSSVHLGRGYILTAYHCMHGKSLKPKLKIYSPETNTLFNVGTNYEMYVPDSDGDLNIGAGESVPQPDLTLIKMKNEAASLISKLRRVWLPTRALTVGDKYATIAGYGRDGFGEEPGVGRLKYGPANVTRLSDLFYHLNWSDDSHFSAGLPGDSGGPLLKRSGRGALVVYGIASVLGTNEAKTKGGNLYVRLDTDAVSSWLSEYIELE